MDRKSTQKEVKEVALGTAFAVSNSFMGECKRTESEMGLGFQQHWGQDKCQVWVIN